MGWASGIAASRRIWGIGICAAATCLAVAQRADAQTLTETLASAYRTNPTLAAARDQVKATDEQLAQAKQYWWRPSLSATLSDSYEHLDQSTTIDVAKPPIRQTEDYQSHTVTQQAELQSQFYLYRGGQTVAAIRNARATILAQEAVLDTTEQSVLDQAATAYGNVVLQLALLEIAKDHVSQLGELKAMIQDMLTSERATIGDLAQVEASIGEAEDSQLSTKADLDAARNAFKDVSGIYPAQLEGWPPLPPPPPSLDKAITIARKENPDLAAARAQVEANDAAAREEVGALLPTISIVGDYTVAFDKIGYHNYEYVNERDRSGTATVTLELTMPLYDGGSTYSLVREAKRTASQSRQQLVATEHDVVKKVTDAWQAYQAASQRINVGYKRWQAASDALAGTQRQFQQGLATVRDLISANSDIINARAAVQQAQYAALTANIELLTAMGQFGASNLKLPVTRYDPKAYLQKIDNLWLGIGLE